MGSLIVISSNMEREHSMSRLKPIEYADAAPLVRAVFNDIKRSRKVDDVNNFWKYRNCPGCAFAVN